jgi:hypothetical protein
MSSKSPVRSCEDVDETALSYAEIKALCAGNPLIAEKMELDIEVAKLRMLKADHQSQHYRLEDSLLKTFPQQITSIKERISGIETDIAAYAVEKEKCTEVTMTGGAASVSSKFAGMTINGKHYTEKEPAAKALLESCKGVTDKADKPIGDYMGFKMSVRFDSFSQQFSVLLRGQMTYAVDLGTDAGGATRTSVISRELTTLSTAWTSGWRGRNRNSKISTNSRTRQKRNSQNRSRSKLIYRQKRRGLRF